MQFMREEVRRRQRENLAAAIARLEAAAAVQSARDLANRRDDPAFVAAGASAPSIATQAQVQRLRRVQPGGRIALEIDPHRASLDDLRDLTLEHDDRISIPTRPDYVTVAGAVANSNALAWQPGRTAADYLRIAGIEDVAEIDNSFILRADGTVSSAASQRSWLGSSDVLSQPLQPGDALIVPNRTDLETWGHALVRSLKDVAQVFGTFGLQAAAIISLRKP